MKAKNILMSILLVMGSIAAKAAGYPPELALVSQPVMVYNYSSITVYYDVENIGDYTYRGYISLYLYPDDGYSYAEEYVKVRPGRIKRVSIDIPLRRIDRRHTFTIMPYYELDDELYSFTTFEYFEPIRFYWDGPRTEPWVVITVPPLVSYYNRPSVYRYYYDGYRPPMPPPPGHDHGHGHGTPPPPMDPKHHTYNYHHNNGGYPANHFNEGTLPPAPHNNSSTEAPNATVRPKPNGGSMSSGHYNSGNSNNNSNPPAPNNGGASTRPKTNGSSSGHPGNSNNSGRVNNGSNSTGNTGNSSGRVGSSNSNSRPSGTNSSSGSTGNSSSNSRVNNSSSNSRSAATTGSSSSRSSSSTRSSSSSNGSSSSRGSNNSSGSGRR